MTAALRLRLSLLVLFLLLLATGLPRAGAQTTQPALPKTEAPALPLPTTRLGDFDMMKERRLIRILVPFSRTIYFLDKGAERGTAAEFGRQFETWLNTKYNTKAARIVGQETVQYVSNIYKYDVAYKLLTDHAAETQKAKEASTTTP
jgi:membrane-bound lytic murein transglycosylase MltF